MKYLLVLLLTGCVAYKDRVTGEWKTDPLFWGSPTYTDTRLTVHVIPDIDAACERYGIVRACTIGGIVYLKGKPQNVTMKLSAEYIASLPKDCGWVLADKLGIELTFSAESALTHEFRNHIIGIGHRIALL